MKSQPGRRQLPAELARGEASIGRLPAVSSSDVSAMVGKIVQIGRDILARQNEAGWGAKVIQQLADDLRREFPRT